MTGTRGLVALATAVLAGAPAAAGAGAALEDLERAVLAQPGDAQAAAELAQAYRAAGALERGVQFFEGFHARHPPNLMSLVWQGSLKTMISAQGDDMEARLESLQTGIADMDRAVQSFPDDARVRVVRGVTISHFPAFLGMHNKAIRDLEEALQAGTLSGAAEATAREGLARAYRQAGRTADADAVSKTRPR